MLFSIIILTSLVQSDNLIVTIEFKGGQFVGVYQGIQKNLWGDLQNRNWLQWELIGNIYSTPSLLQSNQESK